MSKLLSIIIPSYNMEHYLRKCLDSLCVDDAAPFDLLDVIVVNDGSTDSTSAIAHEFAERHPSVFRVIDKPNGHYGSCINRGLKEAVGEFVKVLDADDSFDTNGLKVLLCFLKSIQNPECKIDAVLTDFQKVTAGQKVISTETTPFKNNTEISLDEFTKSPYDRQMHAVTYRRSVFNGLNYVQTEGIAYTDTEWMFLPMTNVQKLTYLNTIVYKYLVERGGQSMDPSVVYRQSNMLYQTLQNKIKEYTIRTKHWSSASEKYARSHLAREVSGFIFLGLKTSRSLAEIDKILNQELREIKPIVGFDGALFANPIIKFLFAKGCCQHRLLRPLMKCLINYAHN